MYLKAVPQRWQTMETPAVNPQVAAAGRAKHLHFSSTWTKHPPLHHLQSDTLSQIRQHYEKKNSLPLRTRSITLHTAATSNSAANNFQTTLWDRTVKFQSQGAKQCSVTFACKNIV